MNRFLKHAVCFLWLAVVSACAGLPEYAQPRIAHLDEPQKTLSKGFPYRQLTLDDFRAAFLSGQEAEHAEQINAHAAIRIGMSPDSRYRISGGQLYGHRYFFGTIERLAFEAIMMPERSWWNPRIPANRRGYVLQHEQIHFALAELAARQLTIDSRKWASEVLVIEPTPQNAGAELARQIAERINAAMKANLKRQAAFDEDTSLFFNPKSQQWWLRKVQEELKQTDRGRNGREID